jgi:hypothetical protein
MFDLESLKSDALNGGGLIAKMAHALTEAEVGNLEPMAKSGLFNTDLQRAGVSLSKAEGVNYPLQGVPFGSQDLPQGQFAPLVPQSIDNVLTSITYSDKHLKLFKMMPRKSWGSTVYEYAQIVTNGSEGLDGFVGEGSVGGLSEASYRRAVAQIKYLTEYFEVTDVATMITGTLANQNLLSMRTQQATLHLARKIEEQVLWADSSLSPNHWDGILAQVKKEAPANFLNSGGARVDADRLQQLAALIEEGPRWGTPEVCFVTSAHYRTLAQELDLYARAKFNEGTKNFRLGADGIEFVTPFGNVVKLMPLFFLDRGRKTPIPTAVGDGAPPASLALSVSLTPVAGPVAGSGFTAADAGRDYYFAFEIVGDEGTLPTGILPPVTITAAGDAVKFNMNDGALPTSGSGSVRYVRVFAASVPSGAAAPDISRLRPAGSFARNSANAGSTEHNILLDVRPDSAPVIISEWNSSVLQMLELLPMMRRPLPVPRALKQQFALLYFAAPVVMQPNKMIIDMNVESRT